MLVEMSDMCAVDEVAAYTELEVSIHWNGSKPLILVGDQAQLPPYVFSEAVKHENGHC